jgi:hypothetical protein
MKFHPYAETYPLLEGEEYETFKNDIADRGVREPVKFRIVNGKKQGLDGRNRLRACAELGISCPEEKVSVEDAEVETYIDSLNLHRRHLTREERQERVLRMRERGHSLRHIAAAVGASPATVLKDITDAEASAGVQFQTPENGQPSTMSSKTIAGRDGKTYSRKKKRKPSVHKPPQPCSRCLGLKVPACPKCQEKFPRGFPTEGEREPGSDDGEIDAAQEITDAAGVRVPDQAVAAFQALPLIETLGREFDALRRNVEDLAKGPAARLLLGALPSIKQHLKDAKGSLMANRPAYVCPYCKGKKGEEPCKCCQDEAWVNEVIYNQAPKK